MFEKPSAAMMIALRDFVFRHEVFVEAREFDDGCVFTRQPKGRSKRVGPRRHFEVFLRRGKRRVHFFSLDGRTSEDDLRAVVFVVSTSKKGTSRSGQEYESPLLVLTGTEYAAMPFQILHDRLSTALRGSRPRLVLEVFGSESATTLVFEDGSTAPGPPITK